MTRTLEHRVERLMFEVDRYKIDGADGRRQVGGTLALFSLCALPVDLKDLYARKLRHAPGAPIVTGAEDDKLLCTGGDRSAYRGIDGGGTKRDKVRHSARCLEPDAALSVLCLLLNLRK